MAADFSRRRRRGAYSEADDFDNDSGFVIDPGPSAVQEPVAVAEAAGTKASTAQRDATNKASTAQREFDASSRPSRSLQQPPAPSGQERRSPRGVAAAALAQKSARAAVRVAEALPREALVAMASGRTDAAALERATRARASTRSRWVVPVALPATPPGATSTTTTSGVLRRRSRRGAVFHNPLLVHPLRWLHVQLLEIGEQGGGAQEGPRGYQASERPLQRASRF